MYNTLTAAIGAIYNDRNYFEGKLFLTSTATNQEIAQYKTRMDSWIRRAPIPRLNAKQKEAVFGISQCPVASWLKVSFKLQ